MVWIIGSLALILFEIFFVCMLITGRRADQICRDHFAEFLITNSVAEKGMKGESLFLNRKTGEGRF